MDIIKVTNLSKSYGKFLALKGVDLKIRNGEFFGCFGPNAAGKTTLLKILTGQLEQSGGDATVYGLDVLDDPIKIKSMIGIVPEFESPPSFLTPEEYLFFICQIRDIKQPKSKIRRWIKFFEFEGHLNTICKDLSKGMRQKVMLASAFIHEPKLLFLDEPFINLDPIFQKKVKEYLRKILKSGVTIFMCTHLLEMAEKLCDRIAILNKGRIIACDSIKNLRAKPTEDLGQIFFRLVENDSIPKDRASKKVK
jgi:ABC-2 type transport system ATP-binding protein